MENVPVLIAALGAFAVIATDIVRAHHRSRLRGPQPFEFVRPVHPVGNLRQHVGHDLSELGGLSQSNHFGANSRG